MPAPSSRTLAVGAFGVLALAGAVMAVFVTTARRNPPVQAEGIAITVTDTECRPASLTVPAGKTTFVIRNEGTKPQEWEIIQGVMVIEERENIAPGLSQKMTVTLEPGDYQITCGNQSKFSPELRGKLIATPSATGAADANAKPKAAELVGALAEYRFFLLEELGELKDAAQSLADAVQAGDLAQAQSLYPTLRAHYERIKPVAELFSDLDGRLSSRADEHDKREDDPAFAGFHRLEYGLFARKSLDGLAPVITQSQTDLTDLELRIRDLSLPPAKMAGGAARLLDGVLATRLTGQEEHYSHTDLTDMAAAMEGAVKIVTVLRPMLVKADKALADRIDANIAQITAILGRYAQPDGGYPAYDALREADRTALRVPAAALAQDLAKLRDVLGLS